MDRLGDGLVYLCRASGEGSHDFRVCPDEASVGAFYQEMTGEDEGGGIDSLWRDFRNPDCWGNDGTALELELYCAKFEVWKVDARQLTVAQSAVAPRTVAVTQCFTAGASSAVSTGETLVCAKCGFSHFMHMRLFDYDLAERADYPTEHPDRCRLLDDTFYDPPIIEDGKSRPHWRCHKKAGHDSQSGGRWCSTHRDCGAPSGDGICGRAPLHDGGCHEANPPREPVVVQSATARITPERISELWKQAMSEGAEHFVGFINRGLVPNFEHPENLTLPQRFAILLLAEMNA